MKGFLTGLVAAAVLVSMRWLRRSWPSPNHAVLGGQARRHDQRPVLREHRRPGEAARRAGHGERRARATTGADQVLPGGTRAKQMTITATITAIDPAAPSITFTGPRGLKYSSMVQDPAALATVKVGDKVDTSGQKRCWCRSSAASRNLVDRRGGPHYRPGPSLMH